MSQDSFLLTIPVEIRMLIYGYLLDDGGKRSIAIRNKRTSKPNAETHGQPPRRRLSYHVMGQCQAYEATYSIEDAAMHPEIMAVNRKMREETSYYLYGRHGFDFGSHFEAVMPFVKDKSAPILSLIREITLHKGCMSLSSSAGCNWASIFECLRALPELRKLGLVIEGGLPQREWDGPQQLSVSDLRFLYATRHESLEWAREVEQLENLEELTIMASRKYVPRPTNNASLVFAAFSASIETSLIEFLTHDLNIPARAGNGEAALP